MDYTGKICDGCREPLEKDEDIVVCPECGTPQHRSCYEKNNRCVNEYLHSPDFVWTDPEPKTDEPQKAQEEQPFREEGGSESYGPFRPTTPQSMENVFMRGVLYDPKEDIGGATVGEAADYIQSSAPRYISKLMKMKKKNRKLSWNWAAFIFSPFWFFYRKLYKAGSLFLALSIALTLATVPQVDKLYPMIEEWVSVSNELVEGDSSKEELSGDALQKYNKTEEKYVELTKSILIPTLKMLLIQFLVPNMIAAVLANYILKRKMLRVISLSHESSQEAGAIKYTIMRNGGVSVLMPIIAIMIETYLPSLLLEIAYKI